MKNPTDFDDVPMSPSCSGQKLIKHVSTLSPSVVAPFVTVSLNHGRRRRSEKTSRRQRQLTTSPDPAIRWRSGTERGTFVPCTGSDLVALSQQEQIERAGWIDLTFNPCEEDLSCSQDRNTAERNDGWCCFLKL